MYYNIISIFQGNGARIDKSLNRAKYRVTLVLSLTTLVNTGFFYDEARHGKAFEGLLNRYFG